MLSAEIISALSDHSGSNQALIVYFIVGALEGKESSHLKGSVAVSPAPLRVPSQRPLASSVTSVTSVANDKGDKNIHQMNVSS